MTSKLKKKIKALSDSGQYHKRFIMVDYHLLQSEAFREIKGEAFKLYLKVRERFNGLNNGEISYSVREASEILGISKSSASKYFIELKDKGFLKIKQKGSYNLKSKHATTWIITSETYNNHPKSRDFMRWKKGSTIN